MSACGHAGIACAPRATALLSSLRRDATQRLSTPHMEFKLHPLVLLNISDHHTRCVDTRNCPCVLVFHRRAPCCRRHTA